MKKLAQQILSAHKESGQNWLDELPHLVSTLADHWQIQDLIEYDNLSWNYVAKGIQYGRQVALKVSYDLPSLQREVSALRAFPIGSCVEVIDFDQNSHAVLLEEACPGKDLMSPENMDVFTVLEICCGIAQKIQFQKTPTQFPFESVEGLVQNLEKEWAIPGKMLLTARKFKKELLPFKTESHIIHGDLHRGNILSHGNEWRAIDPKGYVGTLYNEIWPFVHDPATEIPWIARHLGLDEDRLMKWCFVHSILSTTWGLEDGTDTKNIFGLAERIFALLKG